MEATPIRNWVKTLAIIGGMLLLLVVTLAPPAKGGHALLEISIPIDTVVRADEGTITHLATADVPEGFTDHLCSVAAHAENQQSVHPDNHLLVESGTSQVRLEDVESEPGGVVEATQSLELGDEVTVSLIMGPDQVFSAGMEVSVECLREEPSTTTTVEVSPTSVTTAPEDTTTTESTTTTTVARTTTTAAPSDTQVTTDISTSTSIEVEVLGTEVLPFTGVTDTGFGLLGLSLVAMGALLVASARGIHD